jgi:hypothetical protein
MDLHTEFLPDLQVSRDGKSQAVKSDVIADLAASERGDHRVIAAVLRIEQELSELDQLEPTPVETQAWGGPKVTKTPRTHLPRPVRAPHARANRSQTSHGGTRKSPAQEGGSDSDCPPETAPTRVTVRPNGSVLVEQDEVGTGRVFRVVFDTIGGAVRTFLDFEKWARANGTWIGPSYCDAAHPLNPLIRDALRSMEVEGNA